MINDMGPWREYAQDCYHSECDDTRQLTTENLSFMRTAIDAMAGAVFSMSRYQ